MKIKTSVKTHEGRLALVTDAAQGIGQAIGVCGTRGTSDFLATDESAWITGEVIRVASGLLLRPDYNVLTSIDIDAY